MSPEPNRQAGVCYALTDAGVELPVIDVTHPAFAVRVEPGELDAAIDHWVRGMRRGLQTPAEALRAAAQQSILMRATLDAAGTFMSGLNTYLYKLGAANLGEYASDMDRAIAGNVMALSLRLRLSNMARLIAAGLAVGVSQRPGPVHVLNIAGGTASDSLNALILLAREHARDVAGRRVCIHLLDPDQQSARFAARALSALRSPAGPLQAVSATIERLDYDWSDVAPLRQMLGSLEAAGVVMAGSSEGGLFEYGSDDQILQNLEALHDNTPDHFVMVGSVMHDRTSIDPRLTFMEAIPGRPAFRFIGRAGLAAIAARAGWSVACCIDCPFHQVVSLTKM